MSEAPQAEPRKVREAFARLQSGLTARNLALLAVGALFGLAVSQAVTHWREAARLAAARQKAEAEFNRLAPGVETQLAFLDERVDEIRRQAAQGILATNSIAGAVSSYEAQQRRMRSQLEQADRLLSQLTTFADQLARDFRGRTDLEILPAEQQRKLSELQARHENTQRGLRLLASEVSFAKERQLQLALAEADAAKRSEADALRRAEVETEAAERARAELSQRTQSESALRAQAETAQRAQIEAAHRAQTDALQRLLEVALLRSQQTPAACQSSPTIYIQPAVSYANDLLVIGRRYHDAYYGLGYGYNRPYYSGYHPGFGRYASYRPCFGSYTSPWFY